MFEENRSGYDPKRKDDAVLGDRSEIEFTAWIHGLRVLPPAVTGVLSQELDRLAAVWNESRDDWSLVGDVSGRRSLLAFEEAVHVDPFDGSAAVTPTVGLASGESRPGPVTGRPTRPDPNRPTGAVLSMWPAPRSPFRSLGPTPGMINGVIRA